MPAETHLFGQCYASWDWVAPRGVTENVQKVQSLAIGFYAEATSASVGLLPCWWPDTRSPLAPSYLPTATIFRGMILSLRARVSNKMWHLGGQIMKIFAVKPNCEPTISNEEGKQLYRDLLGESIFISCPRLKTPLKVMVNYPAFNGNRWVRGLAFGGTPSSSCLAGLVLAPLPILHPAMPSILIIIPVLGQFDTIKILHQFDTGQSNIIHHTSPTKRHLKWYPSEQIPPISSSSLAYLCPELPFHIWWLSWE